MDTARSRRRFPCVAGAFTLIELLTVIAILAILLAMLLPTLGKAMEHSRTSNCQHNLMQIGMAYTAYSHDSQGYLSAYVQVDNRLEDYYHNNNPGYEYAAWYDYHNVLAPYLGLGNCMPGTPNWAAAKYSSPWDWRWNGSEWGLVKTKPQFDVYCCPGARNVTSPYSIACNTPAEGVVSGSYMQNACWLTMTQGAQNRNVPGCSWPMMRMSCNLFQQPDKAVVLYEQWSCNGMTGNGDATASPYSTHYKVTTVGAVGIGRSMLYADWHVTFLPTGDWPVKYDDKTNWWYTRDIRGNDEGIKFIDQWFGEQWEAWYPRRELLEQS